MTERYERLLAKTIRDALHQVEDQIVGEAKQYHGTDKHQGLMLAAEIVQQNIALTRETH